MLTNRDFSFIAWCPSDHLKLALDTELLKGHLSFYAFIAHKAEKLELKDHLHVYCVPACKFDTSILEKACKHIDVETGELSSISPVRATKLYDWYYYSLHNEVYLRMKNKGGKVFHYSMTDFVTSSDVVFHSMVSELPVLNDFVDVCVRNVRANKTFSDLVFGGSVPVQQYKNCKAMYLDIKCALSSQERSVRGVYEQLCEVADVQETGDLPFSSTMRPTLKW